MYTIDAIPSTVHIRIGTAVAAILLRRHSPTLLQNLPRGDVAHHATGSYILRTMLGPLLGIHEMLVLTAGLRASLWSIRRPPAAGPQI